MKGELTRMAGPPIRAKPPRQLFPKQRQYQYNNSTVPNMPLGKIAPSLALIKTAQVARAPTTHQQPDNK